MTNGFYRDSLPPGRVTAALLAVFAVWIFAPEIANAAVAFGEIGQNVAENSKGVAKGITMGGFMTGTGMAVWGCVEMYHASCCLLMANTVQYIL